MVTSTEPSGGAGWRAALRRRVATVVSPATATPFALGVGVAVMVGALFRLVHLLDQIPFHDEWHALDAVVNLGFRAIATTFGANDHSIPFTLYFEALARTVGLEELGYRAPFALAGCAVVAVLPFAVRRHVGGAAALAFAWLLAISPILVFYGRTARPYAFTTMGAVLAVVLFLAYWGEGRRRCAAGFIAATMLVGWALLVHLPFCLAPAAMAVGEGLWSRAARGVRRRRAVAVTLAALAGLALLCGLPLVHDWATLSAKAGDAAFGAHRRWPAVIAALGMAGRRVAWAHGALALVGLLWLLRRRPRFTLALLGACAAQVAAVIALEPRNAGAPLVLTRYLLPVVVVILLCAAVGLALLLGRVAGWSRLAAGALGAAALAVPLALGPLPELLPGPSSFASSRLYFRAHYRASVLRQWFADPPAIYRQLASTPPGRDTILEAPYSGRQVVPYGFYQALHRQRVVVGFTDGYCGRPTGGHLPTAGAPGLRFRHFLWLGDLGAIRRAGVRWVILHRQPEDETPWPQKRHLGAFDFEPCLARFTADAGPPVHVEDRLAVFDLGAAEGTAGGD